MLFVHAKVTNVCTLCILEIYSCFDCAGVNGVGQVLDWSTLRHNIKFLYQTRLSICLNIIATYFDENIKHQKKKFGCDWTPNEQITQNIVILYGIEQGIGLQYQICFRSKLILM